LELFFSFKIYLSGAKRDLRTDSFSLKSLPIVDQRRYPKNPQTINDEFKISLIDVKCHCQSLCQISEKRKALFKNQSKTNVSGSLYLSEIPLQDEKRVGEK